jgi:phosphatidylglycerol---prolipoprotein diacylglyceryl transferase
MPTMYPILFKIPFLDLPVYAYGVMLGLGFISSWYLGMYFANREGLPYKGVTWAYVLAIVFALVGARLAHIISNPDTMRMHGLFHALFANKCEGLVAYGGYIGGTLAAYAYCRLRKMDFWSLCDVSSASLVLGLGFTRIGCFLAGCCHGKVTDLPWGVSFPAGSQASRNIDCIAPGAAPGMVASLPVHPTQLYESAVGFLLVPVGIYLIKRRKFTGQAFLIMMSLYAIARFLLEFIRADDDRGPVAMFSTSQFIGLVLVPLAIVLYIWRRKVGQVPPEPLSKEEVKQSLIEQGVLVVKDDKKNKKSKESEKNTAADKPAAPDGSQSGKPKKKSKKKGKKKK